MRLFMGICVFIYQAGYALRRTYGHLKELDRLVELRFQESQDKKIKQAQRKLNNLVRKTEKR
jgi:hypothetical protein